MNGEWWIIDGSATFADGDTGDLDHAGVVIDHALRELADALGVRCHDDYPDFQQIQEAAARQIYEREREVALENDDDELVAKLDEQWRFGEYEDWFDTAVEEAGIDSDLRFIAQGCYHGDERNYAIEHWGWKRAKGDDIDTWRLTPDDIDSILGGLWEIENEDGYGDEEDDGDEEKSYRIHVYSTKKSFWCTVAELESMQCSLSRPRIQTASELWGGAAARQIRKIELSNLHPCYKTLGD